MVAQRAYSSPPTPNRGSTRWRIAARQISTIRILSRFASRPSRTNLSMTQNKTAPTTTMISTLIRTKSMVFLLLARGVRIYIVAACRLGPEDNRACCGARKQWSEKFHLQACRDLVMNGVSAGPYLSLFQGRQDRYTSAYTWRAGDADLTLFGTN